MNQLDHATMTISNLQEFPNINSLWASLIIEECSRLGLTYFCVAPGSRSSPLAIAASTHPLTTCVVCIDERALAFHAVGYARGSCNPAVVITSSGTAVSNLIPAVVEASQDFVPLLLLTADRPPELQDSGANQAINQVNHFGSFVRHFFSLPPPTDEISARMVLTTLDSAVYVATSSPYGPVHINCPFREPLDNSPREWCFSCLKGLDIWMSSFEPFTSYIHVQQSFANNDSDGHLLEVLKIIQETDRGILLIGALHTEEDIWAAILLAKHLSWPVVADILSGLRLRKYFTLFSEIEGNILFVDHLDHILLSNSVRNWIQADVVVQIGSRITSKRISLMLEDFYPCSYIMVDRHSSRHDPLHIVTHRIQSTVSQFTDWLLKTTFTAHAKNGWSDSLRALDMMAAWEIEFIICSEHLLTEPYLAHAILESIRCDSSIFLGNSMPIRDMDMYGKKWAKCTHSIGMVFGSGPLCHWIQVTGNRGASGIDGLLSTAVGFAIGCNKRVVCLIGDVSFLHDTNGLALLKQRLWRKPITILVINNNGGAIFSFLPIAERTERRILDQYFYTSHNVSIQKLCMAHGVKHVQVQTKMELQDAISRSQMEEVDYIIEVKSSIDANATFHSILRTFTRQTTDHSLSTILRSLASDSTAHGFMFCKINKMEYSLYRVQLCAPPTSTSVGYNLNAFHREGFVISLSLDDGSIGFGEVAPLEIHKENMLDVEEQLRFLIHVVAGAKLDYFLPLLKGSFSSWIWKSLRIMPGSIFPSIRCGLEMAILNAISAREGSSLLSILCPHSAEKVSRMSSNVRICALVDSTGSPADIAFVATKLCDEGFSAIKLKVARHADPLEDAAVVQEVRKKVGNQMELRVDANRKWTYDEAVQFGFSVRHCGLQYIEEPVNNEDDIVRFCEETGLPVALDETIDNSKGKPLDMLAKFIHPRIVAIVIKPSLVGGFENAALLARWAHQHGKMAVVSAAFESGLGISAYIQFSCYLDWQNADICRTMNKEPTASVAHGLGTYKWFIEDVTIKALNISCNPCSGFVEASVADAAQILKKFEINHDAIVRTYTADQVHKYKLSVDFECFRFSSFVQEIGSSLNTQNRVLVFLHGFLGTSEDWTPIMKALSGLARCVAIDLPGHGRSKLQSQSCNIAACLPTLSVDIVSDILCKLFHQLTPGKVTLVGYSMGARIALYMALKCSNKVEGAVIISGSPGLNDAKEREVRRAKDDFRACSLVSFGLESFVDIWYSGELWGSLRVHPCFKQIVSNRLQHDDVHALAKILSDLSTGRQLSLWEDLKNCSVPLLLIVGDKDTKYRKIAKKVCYDISLGGSRDQVAVVEVPHCGHAVHLENPLPVIRAVRQFLTSVHTIGLT